jgi:hypothetical protein
MNRIKNKKVMTLHGFMENFAHDEDLYGNPDFPEHIRNQCFSDALDRFANAICKRQRENFFLCISHMIRAKEEAEMAEILRDSLETQPKISDLI